MMIPSIKDIQQNLQSENLILKAQLVNKRFICTIQMINGGKVIAAASEKSLPQAVMTAFEKPRPVAQPALAMPMTYRAKRAQDAQEISN